ncbi:MAG: hypothetical protein WBX15_17375 [Thermoanaerobaculia bacterium]
MSSHTYALLFSASVAGAVAGVLVMWSRKRSEIAGPDRARTIAVLATGTAAVLFALFAFRRLFAMQPNVFAALVVPLVTAWAAVVQSCIRLPVPDAILKVRPLELRILRSRWTAIRAFGSLLRNTPLRALGGDVYLRTTRRDVAHVLRAMYDAETVHLWGILLSAPWLAYWLLRGRWLPVALACAIHVPLNVYPILHLRYASGRVDRLIASRNAPRTS